MWSQEHRVLWQGEGRCSNAAEGPCLTRPERKCLLGLAIWKSLMALTRYLLVARLSGLKGKCGNGKGGNTVQFILWGHYPDAKTRQGYYKKRKLQTNISYVYQCKNLQPCIANRTQQHIKTFVAHHDQEEFIPRMQDCQKPIKVIPISIR